MSAIRVLVADDHALIRAGVRELCEDAASVELVAEASDGNEVIDLVRTHHPDIVLMDITMTAVDGIEATALLKKEFPDVRVIMLSMHAAEHVVLRALRAGASGYMLKDSMMPQLDEALAAVMRGEVYLSPSISRQVVRGYLNRARTGAETTPALTPRQTEILKLIAEGNNAKGIAVKLGVSTKTVDAHRSQIMERLNIRDVPGLVRYAIRNGLVSTDQ